MQVKHNLKLLTIVVATMVPFYIYADSVSNNVGNGVSSVVGGVGEGVKDVGSGVGDAVKDVGNGVGNAFTSSKPKPNADTTTTTQVYAKIKDLNDNNKISPGNNLSVSTNNGVVNISGVVTSSADVDTIKNSVSTLPGVQGVNIDITVKN